MELSDDIMFARPDQRKPEAIIRELKAKARGLRWAGSWSGCALGMNILMNICSCIMSLSLGPN